MPLKQCPGCSAMHGSRKLKCDCGFEFVKKTPNKLNTYIGIGAWINDVPKNMPKVDVPEPLTNLPVKLNVADISRIMAYEGLGFCVFEYIPSDRIKDKQLAKLWLDAKNKLTEIVGYVCKHEQDEEPSG